MRFLAFIAAFFLAAVRLSAVPVISEFMAANATTIKDGHGNYEDWIEIWNPDATSVDLAGWHLTDSAVNLGKYTFPTKVIPAGGRLVVFASNRLGSTGSATHVDALGYLHTNFKLSASGEYLALVQPNGVTKSTEFAPGFPPQLDDFSYGPPATTESLVTTGSSVRYTVPTSATADTASPNWRASNFTDTSWTSGVGPGVGFEAGTPAGVWTLDEAAGATSAADSSGAGLTASLNGTGLTFGTAGHAALTNSSVTFNGSGGLTVPFAAKLNPASAYTFAAWVYPTGGSGYRSIVTSRYGASGAQRGYILYITPGNTWEFWTGTGSAWHILTGSAVTFNAWSHVAITQDSAGNKRIYINGTQVATSVGGYAPNNVTADGFHLGIGDDTGGNFKFVGRMDDAAFWGADIGAGGVVQHRDSAAGSFPTPLYAAHFGVNVQTAMMGVNPGIYTRHNFTVTDRTRYNALTLRMKYADAYVAYLNGVEIARGNFPGSRAFNSTASANRTESQAVVFENVDVTTTALSALVNGANTLAIHGMNYVNGATDFLLTPQLDATLTAAAQTPGYFAVATPGLANSGATVAPGPAVSNVVHSPVEPLPGTALTVTANITPRLAPIGAVTLKYRVMYGAESSVTMADAGPVPGATDGSRIYTANIANLGGATTRQMLRYYVSTTDTSARTWREPYPVDLDNSDGVSQSPEYFGLVVKDAALTAGMPIMQWFTNDVANSTTRTGSRASAYYGGIFYDNIYVRDRGGNTSIGSQKFNFNAGHGIYVNPTLGTVGEVNLNKNPSDGSYFRPSLAFDLYRTAGHPALSAFPIALFMNGSFQRMGTFVEQVDEDFLKRWNFDEEGSLYKFVQRTGETPLAGGDYSNSPAFGDTLYGIEKKTRLTEDFTDLNAFVAGMNLTDATARKTFFYKNVNLPNFVNFMALRSLTAETDVNRKNFYFYRDTNGSLEWFLFPWDKDLTFGVSYNTTDRANPWQATNTYKHDPGATKQWCKLWDAALNAPEIKAMVGRRLRTLMDGMMGASGAPIPGTTLMEQHLEAIRATMTPLPPGVTVSGYADRSSFDTWLAQHRTALYTTYGPASGLGMIPNAATANLTISISAADPNPASGTQDHEYLLLLNSNAEDVDISGWTLSGGGIAHTFKGGTVIPGTSTTSTLNRAYVANNRAVFRTRPGAPTTAEYVLGNYDGALTARGGVVELRNAIGALVSSFSLPTAPTAGQQQLRITKVAYSPSAPTPAELSAMPAVESGDFEYIELQNIGVTSLNLSGYRFTDGFDFTFPAGTTLAAGARIMVAANLAAFDLRYGSGLNRVGPYLGALDNNGERIRIVDQVGEEILDFTYSPTWFPASDTLGYALVIRNASTTSYADWSLPEKWALSSAAGGSPGQTPVSFSSEYAGWKNYVFTAAERANVAVSGPSVVLNSAGISNALAFALNLDPRAPAAAQLPQPVLVNDGGQPYAALRFRRWKNAIGATYTVQVSGDLATPASWQPASVQISVSDNGDSTETVTIRDNIPNTGATSRFLRLMTTVQ